MHWQDQHIKLKGSCEGVRQHEGYKPGTVERKKPDIPDSTSRLASAGEGSYIQQSGRGCYVLNLLKTWPQQAWGSERSPHDPALRLRTISQHRQTGPNHAKKDHCIPGCEVEQSQQTRTVGLRMQRDRNEAQ